MKTLLFPASLAVIAGCARDAGQAPVGEADTGVDARLDNVVTWNYAPGGNGLWPDVADLDGDGKRDLVMGRDGAAAILTFKNTGTSSVFPMSPTATVTVSESSTWGIEERLALGDYNCDGELDAAIGIRGAYTGETNEGQLWFYAGQGGGVFASTPTWILQPNVSGDRMGTDLIAIDANHDGCTDLVAAGDTTVRGVLGKDTGPYLSGATWVLGGGYYGVENLGDVNGDANEDFAWCDGYFNSGLGKVVVFLGTGTGFPLSAHRTYTGASGDNLCGGQQSTRGVTGGDLDGDGYADVIIGVPGAVSGNGRVDVYRGGPVGLPTSPTWTLAGPADGFNGRFGSMVLSGFDQNGDGYEDLVIGEPTRDQVVSNYHGTNWMYPGSPIGPLAGSPTWSRNGTKLSVFGAYGHSAYAMGDVNGDNLDDVLLMDEGYGDLDSQLILGKPDADSDGDGAVDPIDCAPTNAAISPTQPEILGNGLDENCNGYDDCLQDLDKDGYGSTIMVKNDVGGCATVSGEANKGGDCDDAISAIHPNAGEAIADGQDQDCDGGDMCFPDGDGDKHGVVGQTKSADLDCADTGESTTIDDCNDGDNTIYTGAVEVVGDQIDQSCDGKEVCYNDGDKDGFGSKTMLGSADLDCVDDFESTRNDDCNDGNFLIRPGAAEVPASGADENCDKVELCYVDGDGDKFGDVATTSSTNTVCTDLGEAVNKTDCDDADKFAYPLALEVVADGKDQDCDKADDCFKDFDGDAHGSTTSFAGNDLDCVDAGESNASDDCEDANADRFPGHAEVPADGLDQDCVTGDTCYADVDGDTFGGLATVSSPNFVCTDPGESAVNSDCDDGLASIRPGAAEVLADGVDQNCDKGDTCYTDADGDTYGTTVARLSTNLVCTDSGEAGRDGDCKDDNAGVNPAATEIPNDTIDQNCDGTDSCLLDSDGDGFGGTGLLACASGGVALGGDCNDSSTAIKPGATELPADGVDQNCDALESCYVDTDHDGDGGTTVGNAPLGCTATGFASTKSDCADANPAIGPTKADLPGDLVDRNCDGAILCFSDTDDDGFAGAGTVTSADADCDDPGEGVADLDCDDTADTVHPGADEIGGDGVDQDCDDTDVCWHDGDGDGRGDTLAPTTALGCSGVDESTLGGDCDDADAAISPDEVEVVGNTRDDDCDGYADCYTDGDEDGFGGEVESVAGGGATDPVVCEDEGATGVGGDCDDADAETRPDLTEEPFGEDRDCDGAVTCLADADGDGFGTVEIEIAVADGATPGCFVVQGDCDDADKSSFPGATEIAGDAADEDCDGTVDCFVDGDGDGFGSSDTLSTSSCTAAGAATAATDCDDASASANPDGLEVCDGLDNDCDGLADEDFEFADPNDPTTCSEDTVKFCGCDSSPAASFGWMALAFGVFARRRRA